MINEREEARRRGSNHAWHVLEAGPYQRGLRPLPAHHCIENGVLKEGYIWPDGHRGVVGHHREYFPFAHPELVAAFSKLREGDEEGVLAFANKWGLLGYDQLIHLHPGWLYPAEPNWESMRQQAEENGGFLTVHIKPTQFSPGRIKPHPYVLRRPEWQRGDPLPWIWAHAEGIRRLLRLIDLLRNPNERMIDAFLTQIAADRKVPSRSPEGEIDPWLRSRFIFAVGIDPQEETYTDTHNPEFKKYQSSLNKTSIDEAHDLVSRILNGNLRDIGPSVLRQYGQTSKSDALQRTLSFSSLLSVIYWHVSESAIGQRSYRQCVECSNWFEQTHGLQNYCPPDLPGTESRCSLRARQRRHRNDSEKRHKDLKKVPKEGASE